ncbi:hypothetical protein F5884DRAFT_218856 [Xylogone sp. PMI_703]|nr:hypothetical protein F5884DRAFT_218856 [Xylogone sp. PMI_703]
MAARPGEELVATLFSDLHYYYSPPNSKPPHHRFDKGSYLYLFENASQRRARIEVANNPGSPDQDAFNGHLDTTTVLYSYSHSTLVTLTVNGIQQQNTPADTSEWHLPTYDPKNEQKFLYKLHTIDIYFWTKEDALQFVNGIRRVLPPYQVTVQGEPAPSSSHPVDMSPVVQRLENVAIADPSYHNAHNRNSASTTSTLPPPPGPPPVSTATTSQDSDGFAPLAYNPAAPAAPEAIKHREKTPPPPDAGSANPLATAAASDEGQHYGAGSHAPIFPGPPSGQPPVQQSYFPGPPQSASAPPPSAGLQSPFSQSFSPQPQMSFAPPPTAPTNVPSTQYANHPGSSGISSPLTRPGIYSPGLSGVPAPPPGGYSNYSYSNTAPSAPLMNDYAVHQQLYRPTEGEATTKYKPGKPPRGKLEERAGQLEKSVGGFLKKLEKKIG